MEERRRMDGGMEVEWREGFAWRMRIDRTKLTISVEGNEPFHLK